MKYLSIIIPCYNSEKYLQACLASLLFGHEDKLEIIIVNDGSVDSTSKIAHEYENQYPSTIQVIDSENSGHGGAINKALKVANGLFIKVLDSDDLLLEEGVIHLLNDIEQRNRKNKELPDIYLSDYVVHNIKTESNTIKGFSSFAKCIDTFTDFSFVKKIKKYEHYFIHMFTFKNELMRKHPIQLLEKTFYEDNQLIFHILKNSVSLIYLSKPISQYNVGSDNQSISLANIDKNFINQINVMHTIIDCMSDEEYRSLDKYHKYHMLFTLRTFIVLTFYHIYCVPKKEKSMKYKELVKYFKRSKPYLYRQLKRKTIWFFISLCPPFLRGFVARTGNKLLAKKEGFN